MHPKIKTWQKCKLAETFVLNSNDRCWRTPMFVPRPAHSEQERQICRRGRGAVLLWKQETDCLSPQRSRQPPHHLCYLFDQDEPANWASGFLSLTSRDSRGWNHRVFASPHSAACPFHCPKRKKTKQNEAQVPSGIRRYRFPTNAIRMFLLLRCD